MIHEALADVDGSDDAGDVFLFPALFLVFSLGLKCAAMGMEVEVGLWCDDGFAVVGSVENSHGTGFTVVGPLENSPENGFAVVGSPENSPGTGFHGAARL